jgi:hypothetical protein
MLTNAKPSQSGGRGMAVPFILFWVLLFLGREDLGLKGIGIAVLVWAALLSGLVFTGLSPLWFTPAMVIVDIALLIYTFGDIKIR